jgi:hypothetical protein
MLTFSQKPLTTQQFTPSKTAKRGQRLIEADTVNRIGKPHAVRAARFGHDFGRVPVHSSPSVNSPTSQRMGPNDQIRERVRAFSVVSAKASLRPHEDSPETQRHEAEIYGQGKTPLRINGRVAAWDAKPLGAEETGAHLRQIRRQFGRESVERSVRGLVRTRGEAFADSAAKHGNLPDGRSPEGGAIGQEVVNAIRASNTTGPLPEGMRRQLTSFSGYDFDGISIHNDVHANRAADLLNARAFTLGRRIYFAQKEYQPLTSAGGHLLAHEVAHALQHPQHESEPNEHARTTASVDREEEEAKHFADAASGTRTNPPPVLKHSAKSGLVYRAISFTHAAHSFIKNAATASEGATGFSLSSNPAPAFQWDTDVTIHGVAGDPFSNFQVGFLQVEREFQINVHWGSGANHTHRRVRPDSALPRRDATAAGNNWYDDGGPSVAPAFTGNGDVRSPSFDDTPGTGLVPWANPIAGRVSNSGWFNWGDAFVTYLSARDTISGAFRDLANVYWNLSASGRFDTTKPVGSRVTLTSPGNVNRSRVLNGGSGEFPAIHGGNIANGHDTTTDT